MTRTVAYLRVSTDKQADKGVSLDAQRAKVAAYVALYDLELVATIVDRAESAKTLNRPGLQRALAMLKTGAAEALLVVKLDRLTRSVRDLGELVDDYFASGKSALLSVGEQIDTRSAAGRLVLNVLASVGQWEREAIGERTSVAMQLKSSRGEFTGGAAPYGYRLAPNGVHLQPLAHEQRVLAKARQLRASGLSLRAIAAVLQRHGHRSRAGKVFAPVQVARMVDRSEPNRGCPPQPHRVHSGKSSEPGQKALRKPRAPHRVPRTTEVVPSRGDAREHHDESLSGSPDCAVPSRSPFRPAVRRDRRAAVDVAPLTAKRRRTTV